MTFFTRSSTKARSILWFRSPLVPIAKDSSVEWVKTCWVWEFGIKQLCGIESNAPPTSMWSSLRKYSFQYQDVQFPTRVFVLYSSIGSLTLSYFFSFFLLILQDLTSQHNPRPDSNPSHPCSCKSRELWSYRECSHLNRMCRGLLLLLCHGLWAHTQHTLRGDLPHKGSRPLHRHMRPHVLDRRHHRNLLAPRAAQLHRSSRCFRYVCRRLRRIVGFCLPQGSGNQGHASWSDYGVLFCWCQAESRCFQEQLSCSVI